MTRRVCRVVDTVPAVSGRTPSTQVPCDDAYLAGGTPPAVTSDMATTHVSVSRVHPAPNDHCACGAAANHRLGSCPDAHPRTWSASRSAAHAWLSGEESQSTISELTGVGQSGISITVTRLQQARAWWVRRKTTTIVNGMRRDGHLPRRAPSEEDQG